MNLTEKAAGHWVCCSLPDGRVAIADAENPDHAAAVKAIRARNFPFVAAWLDLLEPLPDGQLFTWEHAA